MLKEYWKGNCTSLLIQALNQHLYLFPCEKSSSLIHTTSNLIKPWSLLGQMIDLERLIQARLHKIVLILIDVYGIITTIAVLAKEQKHRLNQVVHKVKS